MTRTDMITPLASRAAVVGVGGFGEKVATLMAGTAGGAAANGAGAAGGGAGRPEDRLDAVFRTPGGPVVLALWRPFAALCGKADELAFQFRRVWLPVVMDHPHVRVGPLVVPGSGACFGCFQARRAQHDSQRAVSAAVQAAYDRGSELGPQGHLCQHARIAAALASVMLGQLAGNPGAVAGHVVSSNVLASGIRRHRVLSYPGCPRCGQPMRPGDSDALAGLIAAIAARRRSRARVAGQSASGGAGEH